MHKSNPDNTSMNLATKYKIVQTVINSPIIPEVRVLWNSIFYSMTDNGLEIKSWCEFKQNNTPVHHLRILNNNPNYDLPRQNYSKGLLSKLVHYIITYRHEHENLTFILNWGTAHIAHPNRFYKKLDRDIKTVESGCSLTSLGQKSSETNLLATTLEGYKITTKKDINIATGKDYYSLTIADTISKKRMIVYDTAAEKIFKLLQKKNQKVR